MVRGSVRRDRGRVRINVSLSDAQGGFNRWAERYDGKLDDIFSRFYTYRPTAESSRGDNSGLGLSCRRPASRDSVTGIVIRLSQTLLRFQPQHVDDAERDSEQHTENPGEVPHVVCSS